MRSRDKKPKLLNELGQSTVEFALTLILLMGFVLFYLQLALVFSFGNYVHYATFMAARAYLAAGPTHEDQVARAQSVIITMLKKSVDSPGVDRFPSIAKGVGGDGDLPGLAVNPPKNYNPTDTTLSWMQGVRYTFSSRVFVIPLGKGLPSNSSVNSVTLTSESWLGSEPAYDECQNDMKPMKGLFDNGC